MSVAASPCEKTTSPRRYVTTFRADTADRYASTSKSSRVFGDTRAVLAFPFGFMRGLRIIARAIRLSFSDISGNVQCLTVLVAMSCHSRPATFPQKSAFFGSPPLSLDELNRTDTQQIDVGL